MLHYTTPYHITLHYTTLHYTNDTTLQGTTLHYITATAPLHYTTLQLQLQLQLLLQLRYATLHPAAVVRWPLQPLQPFKNTQLQPPVGPSVDSLCHPWFTTTNVSYRFLFLKLPPPPCAKLLVTKTRQHQGVFFVRYGFLQSKMHVFELRF